MITFTDSYSKVVCNYFLNKKSDTITKLIQFKSEISAHLVSRKHFIRSDWGGEYLNTEWTNNCNLNGISVQYSSIYSSEQNGVAERMNRTLNDMTRAQS